MSHTIVYIPSTTKVTQKDDVDVFYAALDLVRVHEGTQKINDGSKGLDALDCEGGQLFVVGHGNAGGKIGAHGHEAVGARSLVRQLLAEGLPLKPENVVTIYLHACATGASVRTSYCLWRKDPYAQRFAAALANAGAHNYNVVGYAGFVNASGQMSLNYHVQKRDKRNFAGITHAEGVDEEKTIEFTVRNGVSAKTRGANWKQFTTYNMHRGRANSQILQIRQQ